ncbi:hypothetical protein [Pseudomonas sp. B5(2017)]|uniref:hypothetical protein n=1 Tax=Pseudomonas sp. B5(2017) TaxID=1981714 RepID=UPI001594D54B|nr:hypothetical protein [Pseudomonas sp. B5(2017)]
MNAYSMGMPASKKQKAKSQKAKKPKSQKAKKPKSLSDGFDMANSPFAMATLTHLFALTASHFLPNAAKSNQKTLRSHHPAPALRSGVPSRRSCSREYALQAPSMGPQRLTGIHARHLPPQDLCSAS